MQVVHDWPSATPVALHLNGCESRLRDVFPEAVDIQLDRVGLALMYTASQDAVPYAQGKQEIIPR